MRLLQATQGKLIAILDQRTSPLLLLLSREEMAALKTLIEAVHAHLLREPATTEHIAQLADLRALSMTLERY